MIKNKNMVLSHKCSCGPSLTFLRNICIHSVLECNHYKALGLNSSATQSEIKSAYYELSKKYHPDKNQGSEKSAKLFRDITAAYEVLGNEKLRKQYDREHGMFKTLENFTYRTSNYKADYNDEIERMYYERQKKKTTRIYYGKTPHFDFDAWYRAHYMTPNKYYGMHYDSVKKKYRTGYTGKENPGVILKRKMKYAIFIYFLAVFSVILWGQEKFHRKK